jgi:hypothetical protein
MRMKAEDVEVDDPRKAMGNFQAALRKIVTLPKTVFKAKRKHKAGRLKRTPKR